MEVYNINVTVPTNNRIEAVRTFMRDTIAQYLSRYNNVSYLSDYDDGSRLKILFDVGFSNVAFGFIHSRTELYFTPILSKKTDVDNFDTLYSRASNPENQISMTSGGYTFNCILRVIARDNNLIAMNIGKAGSASEWWFVMDEDNRGRKYLMVDQYKQVYYDGDDSCTKYQIYNANSAVPNPMEGVVLESLLYIYSTSTGVVGLSTNLKSMLNVNLPTTKGSIIDVAGVKYVAMDMANATAHQNVWVYDKEYGM